MINLWTRSSITCILVWSNSMNKRTSINISRTLAIISNSINESRDVYLWTGDDIAGDGDGGIAKSSMSSGERDRSSWRRTRRDVAPPDLDGRWPVVKIESSRARSASQKPYSSPPGTGSQGRGFRRPALPIVGARGRSGWRDYDGSATARRGKY